MRRKHLPLALCLALGVLGVGPAMAQDKIQDQAKPQTQDQMKAQTQDQAKPKILILETDHSAQEAKDSLQGQSHDRGDGGHGGPSAGFGGMGPSHGGGPSPHR